MQNFSRSAAFAKINPCKVVYFQYLKRLKIVLDSDTVFVHYQTKYMNKEKKEYTLVLQIFESVNFPEFTGREFSRQKLLNPKYTM